ncbi:MAG: division/cell wall cluster transcriptional repressor MraZ [Elusimicrobiales bacterium]
MAFFGIHRYRADDKGRLSLPPDFRAALKRENGAGFVVTTGPENCLYLFLPSQWEALASGGLPASGGDKRALRAFRRYFFGNAAQCAPDAMGRILLAPAHREHASIGREAVIVGVGGKAEIWDAARWKKYNKTDIAPRAKEFAKVYDI